jgi:hypothetical protein
VTTGDVLRLAEMALEGMELIHNKATSAGDTDSGKLDAIAALAKAFVRARSGHATIEDVEAEADKLAGEVVRDIDAVHAATDAEADAKFGPKGGR